MAGTKEGGIKCRDKNIEKFGADFYSRIGKMGGKAKTTKPRGFAAMPFEKVSAAGKKGARTRSKK